MRNKPSPEPALRQHPRVTLVTAPPIETTTTSSYVPRYNVVVSVHSRITIKREIAAYHATSRNVKQEPGIYMTRRKNPKDQDRDWRFVHVSGRRCNQGGHQDRNSQSENESEEISETLPDLPVVPDPTLSVSTSNQPNTTVGSTERNSKSGNTQPVVTLISPPAIRRQLSIPEQKLSTRSENRNLNDLLCTLNFDVVPTVTEERSTARPTSNTTPSDAQVLTISSDEFSPTVSRKVVTLPTSNQTSVNIVEREMPDISVQTTPIPSMDITRKVVTPTSTLRTPDNGFPPTPKTIGSDEVASKDSV